MSMQNWELNGQTWGRKGWLTSIPELPHVQLLLTSQSLAIISLIEYLLRDATDIEYPTLSRRVMTRYCIASVGGLEFTKKKRKKEKKQKKKKNWM